MERTTLLRPRRAIARRCLWGAALALGCVTASAQDTDSNAFAVAFTGGATSASGVVSGVQLNVEITDDQVAQTRDFRSMSLLVDVDCRGDRERLHKAVAFDQPNLTGAPKPLTASGEWADPEAYMTETIRTICALHGMRLVEHGPETGGGLALAPAVTPPPEPPSPPPAAEPAIPPEAAASPPPSPVPSPVAAPDPGPEHEPYAASPGFVASPATQPTSSAAAAAVPGQARVQIASSPSRAEAEAMLGRSAALIQPPLRGAIEVATVRHKTVYRSIIAPFASDAEARAFCARTGLTLDGCFVWGR
jgi:hypothetical protein